jgi:tetratricopeptide (TPR) repeat protein
MRKISRNTVKFFLNVPLSMCLLTFVAMPVFADLNKVQTELTSFKEVSKIRLDNTRELLQKDIQSMAIHLDIQDKRFDALNSQIDQSLSLLSNLLSGLGIVLALGGLVGYFSAQNKAKKEARNATDEWFETHANEIQNRINLLQATLKTLEDKAESSFNSHMVMIQEQRTLTTQAMDSLQQAISETKTSQGELSENAALALSEAAMATKNKPENQFNFNDWNTRAFDSFRKNQKENAIQFWRSAANLDSATTAEKAQAQLNIGSTLAQLERYLESIEPLNQTIELLDNHQSPDSKLNLAKALSAKAVSFGKLKKFEKSIEVCDELIGRYGTYSDDADIRSRIAETLFHKAISFDYLDRYDESIAIHEDIIKRFDQDSTFHINKIHLRTIINRIGLLIKLNRNEESNAAFDTLISEFGDSTHPEIRSILSTAKNTRGFKLLCQAKENWANVEKRTNDLQLAFAYFNEAKIVQPENAVYLGNIAYSTHLLEGDQAAVRENLTKAIEYGQQSLYDATLVDLEIHPVGDADDIFRALLEEIWKEHKKAVAKSGSADESV